MGTRSEHLFPLSYTISGLGYVCLQAARPLLLDTVSISPLGGRVWGSRRFAFALCDSPLIAVHWEVAISLSIVDHLVVVIGLNPNFDW